MHKRLLILIISIVTSQVLSAQSWNPIGSGIPIPDLTLQDQYGYSISINDNVAVIGAPGNDDVNLNAGKAFVYEKIGNHWELISELILEFADPEVQFGKTVLAKDDFILVGIPNMNGFGTNQEGRVMVYKKNSEGCIFVNELKNDSPSSFDHFGTSLSFINGLLAVGAPGSTDVLENSGAVFLFDNIEIESHPMRKITAPELETSYKFGMAVALSQTKLFVGDTRSVVEGSNKGAVFVYDLLSYNLEAKLTTSNSVFNFGGTIACTNNEVAVNSMSINANNTYGSVYVFERPLTGWVNATENIQLLPSNIDDYGNYGSTIYLDDENLVIGSNGGIAVDFFEKPVTGWNNLEQPFTLKKNSFTYLQRFGFSFAINGSDVIVGAYNWNVPAEYSGAAFAFQKDGSSWSSLEEKEILKGFSSNASGDKLGFSVDVDGAYAVSGAPYDDTNGESSGAAYIFKFNGTSWDRIAKLTPSDGTELDYFGWKVAINANTILVSALEAAPTNEEGVYSTGKVYVFEKPSGEWVSTTETTQIQRLDNSHRGSFGFDLDIDNEEIVISHFDAGSSEEIGLVYIFTRSGGNWIQKALLQPNSSEFRQFGSNLVMKDNLIAVSAPISNFFDGKVLVYERPEAGWVNSLQKAVLQPSDGAALRSFGNSIDIHENTILVGGVHNQLSSGAGYIFEKSGEWKDATEDAILAPEEKIAGARYGAAVAISRDFAVLSSSNIYSESGQVLFYRKIDGEWKNSNEYESIPNFNESNSSFGFDIALNDDFLMIGAPNKASEVGKESGVVLFYLKQPTVIEVNSTTPDGTKLIDDKIQIQVYFSQPISVASNPKLQISLENNLTRDLNFIGLIDKQKLNFEYTVVAGDFSDDLEYSNVGALLATPAQIISEINEINAINNLPSPGSTFSLSGLRNFVIDGTIVVGIEEYPNDQIHPYPNPFTESFQISTESGIQLEIFSTNGTKVYSTEMNPNSSYSPEISRGFYILEILLVDGARKRIRLLKD